MSESELRRLAQKELLSNFDLLHVLSEMCDGSVTVRAATSLSSSVPVTRSITKELQNARGMVPLDAFKAWWAGFVKYASTAIPPKPTPPAPAVPAVPAVPAPPARSTIKSSPQPAPQTPTIKSPPPARSTIKSPQSPTIKSPKKETQLNSSRVSMPGVKATWNEKWQTLCDACCGVDHVDSPEGEQAAKLSTQYCEEVVKQVAELREKVLKRFLCPLDGREKLKDGFFDRDGCFYTENGSLFVIPLHVLSHGWREL